MKLSKQAITQFMHQSSTSSSIDYLKPTIEVS